MPNDENKKKTDPRLWQDLVAFWILALCNNYGYVVMLSAAHDITESFGMHGAEYLETDHGKGRQCHLLSTGAILLADILPSCIMKIVTPFLPLCINVRIAVVVSLSAASFLLVAFAVHPSMAIIGVGLTSVSCGMGETTFLAYTSKFNTNVVSTWSSGTGGAGVIGSLSYTLMREVMTVRVTMLVMLVVPTIEGLTFWLLLRRPINVPEISLQDDASQYLDAEVDDKPLVTLRDKILYIGKMMKYMVPLSLVYLFEYFINQGLYELVYFEDIFLNHKQQYRWYTVLYQIGVFVSRSSGNLIKVRRIWIMSILQFLNVVYFLSEVLTYCTPIIWIIFVLILWEGLLGGGAYVNTFYRVTREIPREKRMFAMSVVAFSDSPGISLAGFLAIPAHNAICRMPAPKRFLSFSKK